MRIRCALFVGLMAIGLLAATPVKLPMNDVGRVQYVYVTEVPGASPAELMKRARNWLTQKNGGDSRIVGEAQPHCIVVGETFEIPHEGMPVSIYYTLAFEARPGRFCATAGAMYVFDGSIRHPLEHYLNPDGTPRINAWMLESVDRQAREMLAALHEEVLRPKPGRHGAEPARQTPGRR